MSLTVFEVFCIAWGLLIGYLMGSGRLRDLGAAAVFALRAIAAVPLWLYFSWRARRWRRRLMGGNRKGAPRGDRS